MKVTPLLLLVSLLINGCATAAKYQENLDSWVGLEFVRLANNWGYPPETRDLPNGNKEYAYIKETKFYSRTTSSTSDRNGFGYTYVKANEPVRLWCKTYFEVGIDDRILNWRYEGNDCKAK